MGICGVCSKKCSYKLPGCKHSFHVNCLKKTVCKYDTNKKVIDHNKGKCPVCSVWINEKFNKCKKGLDEDMVYKICVDCKEIFNTKKAIKCDCGCSEKINRCIECNKKNNDTLEEEDEKCISCKLTKDSCICTKMCRKCKTIPVDIPGPCRTCGNCRDSCCRCSNCDICGLSPCIRGATIIDVCENCSRCEDECCECRKYECVSCDETFWNPGPNIIDDCRYCQIKKDYGSYDDHIFICKECHDENLCKKCGDMMAIIQNGQDLTEDYYYSDSDSQSSLDNDSDSDNDKSTNKKIWKNEKCEKHSSHRKCCGCVVKEDEGNYIEI